MGTVTQCRYITKVNVITIVVYTVDSPPNKGHIGSRAFILYTEINCSYLYYNIIEIAVGASAYVCYNYRGCPLLGGSINRRFTVYNLILWRSTLNLI